MQPSDVSVDDKIWLKEKWHPGEVMQYPELIDFEKFDQRVSCPVYIRTFCNMLSMFR